MAQNARLTSSMWVAAFLRTEQVHGAYVTIMQKGSADAGAIFIIQNHLNGEFSLFSPAPQALFDADEHGERKFEQLIKLTTEQEISDYLDRQKKFDSDIWIVEVESKADQLYLRIAE